MAVTKAISTRRVVISMDAAGGSAYTAIAEVVGFGGPGESRDTIDVTNLDSPNDTKEFIRGEIDSGELSLDLNYLPGVAAQSALRTAVVAPIDGSSDPTFQIVFTHSGGTSTMTFKGIPTGFEPSGEHDGAVTASGKIKITGAVTVV